MDLGTDHVFTAESSQVDSILISHLSGVPLSCLTVASMGILEDSCCQSSKMPLFRLGSAQATVTRKGAVLSADADRHTLTSLWHQHWPVCFIDINISLFNAQRLLLQQRLVFFVGQSLWMRGKWLYDFLSTSAVQDVCHSSQRCLSRSLESWLSGRKRPFLLFRGKKDAFVTQSRRGSSC